MSFIPNPRITALSHSRINTYEKCPKKAYFKFIKKMQEPSSPAAERGINIHTDAETYLNTRGMELPPTLSGPVTEAMLNFLKDADGLLQTELQVAFDRQWQECEWFAPNVFMRVVWDVLFLPSEGESAMVVDHKTGKMYPEHEDQAKLYGLSAFKKYPELMEVNVRFLYIDQNEVKSYNYLDTDIGDLEKHVEKKVAPILADDTFIATPHPRNCRWCHFRRSNQGPCEHG